MIYNDLVDKQCSNVVQHVQQFPNFHHEYNDAITNNSDIPKLPNIKIELEESGNSDSWGNILLDNLQKSCQLLGIKKVPLEDSEPVVNLPNIKIEVSQNNKAAQYDIIEDNDETLEFEKSLKNSGQDFVQTSNIQSTDFIEKKNNVEVMNEKSLKNSDQDFVKMSNIQSTDFIENKIDVNTESSILTSESVVIKNIIKGRVHSKMKNSAFVIYIEDILPL